MTTRQWQYVVVDALDQGVTLRDIIKACRVGSNVVIDWLTGDMVPAADKREEYGDVLDRLVAATREIAEMRKR